MAGTITLLLPKHIFVVHCLTRIVYTGFMLPVTSTSANQRCQSLKHFSQSEAAKQPITLALQPIRGCQSLMHFSQSEAANHSSTSASQRLPITQELSQSEASYHSSISAIRLRITFVLQPIRLSITQVLQPIRTSHTLFCMKSPKSGYHDCLTSQSTAAEPQAG